MNIRCFPLSALFAAVFVAWGCSGFVETPKGDEVPTAPAPKAKKSKAELLVGSWKMVTTRNIELPDDVEIVLEFGLDGHFSSHNKDRKNAIQKKTGTYKLLDDVIRFTSTTTADSSSETWDVTINTISEEELTIIAGPLRDREHSILKRTKTK